MKIETKEKRYFGYLQGFKVWINGRKYPREHGHHYTAMKKTVAIRHSIQDYYGIEKNYPVKY